MKIRYRLWVTIASIVEQWKMSLLVVFICFLSCWMLGSVFNEYLELTGSGTLYQKMLKESSDDLYYLNYERFPNQEMELRSYIYEDMFQQMMSLDDVVWFGAYEENMYHFDELVNNLEYESFIRQKYGEDTTYGKGWIPALILYGDAWELCPLETTEGKAVAKPDKKEEVLSVYAGYEMQEFFAVGDVFHQDGVTFRVEGILKEGSQFLGGNALYGIYNTINLDRSLVSGMHLNLYGGSGSYVGFAGNTFLRFKEDADQEQIISQLINILTEYEFYGWCQSVDEVQEQIVSNNVRQVEDKIQLLLLMLILYLSILFVAGGIRVLSRQRTFAIWYANGFADQDIAWCLGLEQSILIMLSIGAAIAVLGIQVRKRAELLDIGNATYYFLKDYFFTRTVPLLLLFAIVSIMLPFLLSLYLFGKKTVVELMRKTEQE